MAAQVGWFPPLARRDQGAGRLQPLPFAGIEITLIAAASPIYSCLALAHLPLAQRGAALTRLFVGIIAGLLAAGAGLGIAVGADGALWLLMPAAAVGLVSSVLNAWRLMIDVAETTP